MSVQKQILQNKWRFVVCVFVGRRQLELVSARESLQQELNTLGTDVEQKNSLIALMHKEVKRRHA